MKCPICGYETENLKKMALHECIGVNYVLVS